MTNLKHTLTVIVLILAFLGVLDSSYLTYEHFSGKLPPCSTSIFVDCGKVLTSKYSMVGPIPLSMLGLAYYSTMVGVALVRLSMEKQPDFKEKMWAMLERYARPNQWSVEEMLFWVQMLITTSGAAFSVYFVYLQLGVLKAICLYCMFSALISFSMFGVSLFEYFKIQKKVK